MAAPLKFTEATREQAKLRLAISGTAGAGKTYSALAIATELLAAYGVDPATRAGQICLIDTERGSSQKYASGKPFRFFVLDMRTQWPSGTYHPEHFVEAIRAAEAEGFGCIIVDSLSHEWMGEGGALEQVDAAAEKSRSKNSYMAWKSVTPMHMRLIDAMLSCKGHMIATMRSKAAWEVEERDGKKVPVKVGLAPVQREGMDFEFDVTAEMTRESVMLIDKTRIAELKETRWPLPGAAFAKAVHMWLMEGSEVSPEAEAEAAERRRKAIQEAEHREAEGDSRPAKGKAKAAEAAGRPKVEVEQAQMLLDQIQKLIPRLPEGLCAKSQAWIERQSADKANVDTLVTVRDKITADVAEYEALNGGPKQPPTADPETPTPEEEQEVKGAMERDS